MTFKVSGPSAEHLRGLTSGLGAMLTGRRTFDVAEGWGGNHAWGPAFVLTHHIPAGWPRPNSTVHFVTDGIESAVNQAKAAAAGKSVGVHGADTIQQCLNAGLLDEIHVDIAAVLLGSGVRLFDRLADTPVVLGNPTMIRASALHTCATQYARRSRTPHPFSPGGELQLGETFTREGGGQRRLRQGARPSNGGPSTEVSY